MKCLLLIIFVLSVHFVDKGESARYYLVNSARYRDMNAEMQRLRDVYLKLLHGRIETSMPDDIEKKPEIESTMKKKSEFAQVGKGNVDDGVDPIFSEDWLGSAQVPVRRRHYISK